MYTEYFSDQAHTSEYDGSIPSGQCKHNTDETSDLNACTDARQETATMDVDPSVANTADGAEQQIIPNRYLYCILHLPFFCVENSAYPLNCTINHERSNLY